MASWDIRIVENLYPVLGDDRQNPNLNFGLQQTIDGYGRHEVIIDYPQHGIALHDMSEGASRAAVCHAYRSRMEQLYRSTAVCATCWCSRTWSGGRRIHRPHPLANYRHAGDARQRQAEVTNNRLFYQKNHRCIFLLID